VSSDSIVKGIIDDIVNTALKTADVDEQKTKYFALLYCLLQKRLLTFTLLKLCLTQVLFNKRRMQVKCISIVKGIIDDIVNTALKTADVDEQKTKYLQHFINKHDTIVSN
jgi:hypothetical protein